MFFSSPALAHCTHSARIAMHIIHIFTFYSHLRSAWSCAPMHAYKHVNVVIFHTCNCKSRQRKDTPAYCTSMYIFNPAMRRWHNELQRPTS